MTITEINTPLERRRVIEYGTNGNRVVRHWHSVRHLAGPLYISEISEPDKYGAREFDLFVFFPDVKDGLHLSNIGRPERYTPEHLVEEAAAQGYMDKDTYVASLRDRMRGNAHIGNAMIQFVRQWDAALADRCVEYRAELKARDDEAERQRIAAVKAQEAAEKAEAEAKIKTERDLYLGWADKMTPMQFGKMHTTMQGLIRCDGQVMTKRDFVLYLVRDGWTPEKKEGVTSCYGSKWNVKESKPRTEYRMVKEKYSYKICKTEFDFATYVKGI